MPGIPHAPPIPHTDASIQLVTIEPAGLVPYVAVPVTSLLPVDAACLFRATPHARRQHALQPPRVRPAPGPFRGQGAALFTIRDTP
uniref:hypothetical protein n=1 Tax=Streptomyces chartreusis TaxID=1969 RepID=UPI003F494062